LARSLYQSRRTTGRQGGCSTSPSQGGVSVRVAYQIPQLTFSIPTSSPCGEGANDIRTARRASSSADCAPGARRDRKTTAHARPAVPVRLLGACPGRMSCPVHHTINRVIRDSPSRPSGVRWPRSGRNVIRPGTGKFSVGQLPPTRRLRDGQGLVEASPGPSRCGRHKATGLLRRPP